MKTLDKIGRANFEKICNIVADYLRIPRFSLKMRRGTPTMGYARHISWYYACEWCPGLTQKELGDLLGKKSRTGVIYGQQRIKKALADPNNNQIKEDIIKINSLLNV